MGLSMSVAPAQLAVDGDVEQREFAASLVDPERSSRVLRTPTMEIVRMRVSKSLSRRALPHTLTIRRFVPTATITLSSTHAQEATSCHELPGLRCKCGQSAPVVLTYHLFIDGASVLP